MAGQRRPPQPARPSLRTLRRSDGRERAVRRAELPRHGLSCREVDAKVEVVITRHVARRSLVVDVECQSILVVGRVQRQRIEQYGLVIGVVLHRITVEIDYADVSILSGRAVAGMGLPRIGFGPY